PELLRNHAIPKPIFFQSALQAAPAVAANVQNDLPARPRATRLLPIDSKDGQRWLINLCRSPPFSGLVRADVPASMVKILQIYQAPRHCCPFSYGKSSKSKLLGYLPSDVV